MHQCFVSLSHHIAASHTRSLRSVGDNSVSSHLLSPAPLTMSYSPARPEASGQPRRSLVGSQPPILAIISPDFPNTTTPSFEENTHLFDIYFLNTCVILNIAIAVHGKLKPVKVLEVLLDPGLDRGPAIVPDHGEVGFGGLGPGQAGCRAPSRSRVSTSS